MINKRFTLIMLMALIAVSCTDGYIDDIAFVAPGPDNNAPEIEINYPNEGTKIRVVEDVTTINIDLAIEDDIEIDAVSLKMDGTEIASFNEFIDYRRFLKKHTFETLTNGQHVLEVMATDKSGKSTVKSVTFEKTEPYQPIYDGEIFYLPFDGDFVELVRLQTPDIAGAPEFASGLMGSAYKGKTDASLQFPTDGLKNEAFSAVFWYNLNASPDRAGLLVMGPPDEANPTAMNNRTSGFRLFRENAGGKQRIKLNVGNGTNDSWFDGGSVADIDPAIAGWNHIAFTIASDQVTVYLNGEIVSQNNFSGVDWTGCDLLSVGSGAPRFAGWGHLSTASLMDELRIFNTALTQEEIQMIMAAESN
ncbi:LamG domain-containing protein [uncultured Cyclobacterium sp.]|uniref:LamG domain-containing protein n=1 Tax=uncultured Cyclobacterium sp. TaxID=453820 RepID=UPI0030EC2B05